MSDDLDLQGLQALGFAELIDGVAVPQSALARINFLTQSLLAQRRYERPEEATTWTLVDAVEPREGGPLVWATERIQITPPYWAPQRDLNELLASIDELRTAQHKADLDSYSYLD